MFMCACACVNVHICMCSNRFLSLSPTLPYPFAVSFLETEMVPPFFGRGLGPLVSCDPLRAGNQQFNWFGWLPPSEPSGGLVLESIPLSVPSEMNWLSNMLLLLNETKSVYEEQNSRNFFLNISRAGCLVCDILGTSFHQACFVHRSCVVHFCFRTSCVVSESYFLQSIV